MKLITLEYIRDERRACYSADRLAALYDRPHTPLEVLTRTDGPWADVPAKDRLWTVLHAGVLPDKTLRFFACDCAERALTSEREAGREPDPRSWTAVEVARKYAIGQATTEDMAIAHVAAANVTANAIAHVAAANVTANYAAHAAARAAAAHAALAAALAAANYAALAAALAAERRWQVNHLIDMIQKETTK